MIPLDIDMELLRRLGEVRSSLGAMDHADGVSRLREALDSVTRRASDLPDAVTSALTAFGEAIPGEPLSEGDSAERADSLMTVVDALEQVFVSPGDEAMEASLADALSAIEGYRGGEDPEHGADEGAPVRADSDEGGLHSVASFLVQMEPTLMDSVALLRDHFAQTVDEWPGSDDVRDQLQQALAELDSVVANPRSRKSRRLEAVERVGQVIEVAMQEEEDGSLFSASGAGSSEDTSSREPNVPAETVVAAQAVAPTAEAPIVAAEAAAPVVEEISASEPGVGSDVNLSIQMPKTMDADPELVLDFVAEGLDYLDQAEEALLALESDPSDMEAVNVTFRAFHTIKGVSAFLDLSQVSGIAHEAETLLAQVRDGSIRFTESAADLFLRSADVLRGLLVGIREIVGGGNADAPEGLASLTRALADPRLAEKVANNQPLGISRGPALVDDEAEGDDGSAEARKDVGNASSSQGEDSVRIRTERLDQLVDLVGELVVSHSMISQDPDVVMNRGTLQKKVGQSQKIIRELQDLSTSLRMVPLKPAFHKISRVVRDVSKKSGKNVVLVSTGEETELDRSMVAVVTDPLVHMVRNAIDHGLESPEQRVAAGKPKQGQLKLTARQAGGNVVVEIEDDGRGLNREKILAKAVDRGLVDPERVLSDQEVFALIFQPGFSTAEQVTDISGRGVGMDVVRRAVESLRGRIEIHSEIGVGTRFSIFLPLTLAITDGMLVRVGTERYIVPTVKIQISLRPTREDIWSVSKRGEMVMLHGSLVPIARLHRLFDIEGAAEDPTEALLVVVGEGSRRTGLLVDELLGQQQFVVKPLTGQVANTQGIAGGAILGDGGVGLILDPEEVIDMARDRSGGAKAEAA